MDRAKFTPNLVARLETASAAEILDIILELRSQAEPTATGQRRSHAGKISAAKAAFRREVAPVEETIHQLGGEVTGHAWINSTVRARVPAERVGQLSDLDKVATLDTPHFLKPDSY